MAKIRMDIEALTANAAQIDARITELQALNSRLESLISRIEASWDGVSSIAYIAIMRGHAEKAKKMIAVLTEYKKYVETAIEKFRSIDNGSASRIRNSF